MRRPASWPKSKGKLTKPFSKRRAAEEAGLSLHWYRLAVRIANIPEAEFERLIESDAPFTIAALAATGRRRRVGYTPPPARRRPCPQCGGTGKITLLE